MIVPVPPSRVGRAKQPVIELSTRLAPRLGMDLAERCVVKVKGTPELKDVYEYEDRLRALEGAFEVSKGPVDGRGILLFDDLYRSGATMNAVALALREDGQAQEVCVLALTRTRRT